MKRIFSSLLAFVLIFTAASLITAEELSPEGKADVSLNEAADDAGNSIVLIVENIIESDASGLEGTGITDDEIAALINADGEETKVIINTIIGEGGLSLANETSGKTMVPIIITNIYFNTDTAGTPPYTITVNYAGITEDSTAVVLHYANGLDGEPTVIESKCGNGTITFYNVPSLSPFVILIDAETYEAINAVYAPAEASVVKSPQTGSSATVYIIIICALSALTAAAAVRKKQK